MRAIENARTRSQRIDCGINSDLSQGARKNRGCVEVSERRCRRGIGKIVGRHVDGLHRGDRTFFRRRNPFLQLAHFRSQVRLVSHGAGHAAEQGGNFRSCLGETENVVDEEQRVSAFFIAEEFGDGQPGQSDAQTGTGRLGHLSVNQRGFGFRRITRFDNAGLGHFQPKIVAFAGPFTDAGKDGISAVLLGDVVDQFLNEDGLADTGATEQSDLAALKKWLDEIDDFDTGLEHFGGGGLIFEQRRRPMDGHRFGVLDRTQLIDRRSDHVHHASQRAAAHGHRNRAALVNGFHATHHTLGRFHGNAAHAAFAQVLLHLQNHADWVGHCETVADNFQRLINRRHSALDKLHVDGRTGNLSYTSNSLWHRTSAAGC